MACTWPPREGAGPLERFTLRCARPFPGLPDKAFEDPIFVARPRPGARFTQVNATGARRRIETSDPSARFILMNDPVGVKRVLVDRAANYPKTEFERRAFVTLFGTGLFGAHADVWRKHRRIMAPAFHPSSVATYGPTIAATSEAFRERLDASAGQTLDVGEEMSALTLKVITKVMFSSQCDEAVSILSRTPTLGARAPRLSVLDILPFGHQTREPQMSASLRPVHTIVDNLIAERRLNHDVGRGDLLDRLIAARDEFGVQLTSREIRDEVITILTAGHETTAVTMGWIWYLLSQHPCEEARLHEELRRLLKGRAPGAEDVPKLVYARQIIEETLRLYPPASGLATRVCLAEDEIRGFRIPAGANIVISPFVLHRHRRLWEHPERFVPDRFSPERRAKHDRFSYLPFGAGPRICIGHVLAINELVTILATLAQSHRLRLAPTARVGFVQGITLRPLGLRMIVERRATH